MKTIASFAFITVLSSTAFAQSAPATAPAPQVAQATPGVVVVNTAPAPAPEHPRLQLSAEDQELIMDGEIGPVAHIGGGAVALFFGLGVGQAVQGRWGERGWIFTVGEPAALGLTIYGLVKAGSSCAEVAEGESCGGGGMVLAGTGLLALSALHVWEVVDAFVAPVGHNRRVRAAKLRAGMNPMYSVAPYVAPSQSGNGTVGGLSFSF